MYASECSVCVCFEGVVLGKGLAIGVPHNERCWHCVVDDLLLAGEVREALARVLERVNNVAVHAGVSRDGYPRRFVRPVTTTAKHRTRMRLTYGNSA